MRIGRAASRSLQSKGATYYFCSELCEQKFTARHHD
jgi:YHS domain-containing protein